MISYIEGIGPEVIEFFIFLGVILICTLLWLSTRVRNPNDLFFSTVYVLERRQTANNEDQTRASYVTENSAESDRALPNSTSNQYVIATSQGSSDENTASVSSGNDNAVGDYISGCSKCEVQDNSSDKNFPSSSHSSSNVTSTEKSDNTVIDDSVASQAEIMIKVRLKYLTDESREVEGSLNERLLDFKRRNFSEELAAGKIIRLIFNGRVLRDDNVTLQSHGLSDDCVVHCLIANEKPQQPVTSEQPDQNHQYQQNNEQASVPEWNLSKLLCFFIVGILSLTWYCRFQFATLFTFTSTSVLLGLTVIFLCSMFGTFTVDSVPVNTVG